MTGAGVLASTFNSYLGIHRKTLNTIPANLKEEEPEPVQLYPNLRIDPGDYPVLQFEQEGLCLSEADNDAYNIVVLGPTGAGKSTLINNMFNLTVCKAEPTVESVTKEVKFLKGIFRFVGIKDTLDKKANVIDTIGKCNCKLN